MDAISDLPSSLVRRRGKDIQLAVADCLSINVQFNFQDVAPAPSGATSACSCSRGFLPWPLILSYLNYRILPRLAPLLYQDGNIETLPNMRAWLSIYFGDEVPEVMIKHSDSTAEACPEQAPVPLCLLYRNLFDRE